MVNEFKFFWGVSKKSRVLRVDWRPELSEDINYGNDIETELTRLMSAEISRSIDDQIINELRRTLIGEDNQRA
jgi:hypothetical protein